MSEVRPSALPCIALLAVSALLIGLAIHRWQANGTSDLVRAEWRETVETERRQRLRLFIDAVIDDGPREADPARKLLALLLAHQRLFHRHADGFDSLLGGAGGAMRGAEPINMLHPQLRQRLKLDVLDDADISGLALAGLHSLRVVDTLNPGCDQPARLIREAGGTLVPENIFRPPDGDLARGDRLGGCGTLAGTNTLLAAHASILVWRAQDEDPLQPPGRLIALGLGDDSTLVQPGAPENWPPMPYLAFNRRHAHIYSRYIVLWEIPYAGGPAELRAVVQPDGRNLALLPRRHGYAPGHASSAQTAEPRRPAPNHPPAHLPSPNLQP